MYQNCVCFPIKETAKPCSAKFETPFHYTSRGSCEAWCRKKLHHIQNQATCPVCGHLRQKDQDNQKSWEHVVTSTEASQPNSDKNLQVGTTWWSQWNEPNIFKYLKHCILQQKAFTIFKVKWSSPLVYGAIAFCRELLMWNQFVGNESRDWSMNFRGRHKASCIKHVVSSLSFGSTTPLLT